MAGHYVYVGTAGLANLHWINRISLNQNIIPKLYLVDYSIQASTFWHILKNLMIKSKNYDEFKRHVAASEYSLSPLTCDIHNNYILIQDFDELFAEGASFVFIKEVICKASLMNADWRDPNVFNYIRKQTGPQVPIIVYASNIVEFMGNNHDRFQRDVVLKEGETSIDRLMTTIQLLKPHTIIHARTSYARYKDRGEKISPDRFIFVPGSESNDSHMTILTATEYGYLEKKKDNTVTRPSL
jgi:hypothetical protein